MWMEFCSNLVGTSTDMYVRVSQHQSLEADCRQNSKKVVSQAPPHAVSMHMPPPMLCSHD